LIEYMIQQHRSVTTVPINQLRDMFFLDAMFILAVIKDKHDLSMHVINLGANPSSLGQDKNRNVVPGDDARSGCTKRVAHGRRRTLWRPPSAMTSRFSSGCATKDVPGTRKPL
jgi:hypothetical protein